MNKKAKGVAQVVEYLPSMHEALNSTASTNRKEEGRKEGRKRIGENLDIRIWNFKAGLNLNAVILLEILYPLLGNRPLKSLQNLASK
jgi:hypothetical protein